MKRITAKIGKMRKPQDFIVYPPSTAEGKIVIQSDKSIAMFDENTGKGLLNIKGCYFVHLNQALGAIPYEFPMEFVNACKEAQPHSGDLIGWSPVTGYVYVA